VRESDTFRALREDLEAHGGRGDWIREVCVDTSPAYQKGLRDHLPEANVTFDRFHMVKLLNEAVDQVRRSEREEAPTRSFSGPGRPGRQDSPGGGASRMVHRTAAP